MRIFGKTSLGLAALLLSSGVAYAANLVQVYQQALINDPAFKKAQADWLTAKENLPLAMTGNGTAGSGLFPNVTGTASYSDNWQKLYNWSGNNEGNFLSKSYAVTLTQPIFNLATWMTISSTRYSVKAATATYLAAEQDLMSRTANAYFEVLRANAKLNLTLAQKKQFLHQLVTSEEKYKVGLIAITGVYDAKASYDRSVADEISDRNNLQNQLENLRAITGVLYYSLTDLRSTIPLIIPSPQNIDRWVAVALKQNYTIQADLNNMFAARENIKVAAVGNMPTVNLTSAWSESKQGGVFQPPVQGPIPNTTTKAASVGMSLNFPVFRGGYDIANTKQKRYQYLSASDQLAVDHRTVENNTRQAYLLIDSGISQIKADEQAIISARNQLEATKAGYIVGTRTMVDVLDSVTTLTQTQLAYADDRYNYVEGIISLKQQAGVLSPNDLRHLNQWLGGRVKFSLTQPEVVIRKTPETTKLKANLLNINTPEATDPTAGIVPNTPTPLKVKQKQPKTNGDTPSSLKSKTQELQKALVPKVPKVYSIPAPQKPESVPSTVAPTLPAVPTKPNSHPNNVPVVTPSGAKAQSFAPTQKKAGHVSTRHSKKRQHHAAHKARNKPIALLKQGAAKVVHARQVTARKLMSHKVVALNKRHRHYSSKAEKRHVTSLKHPAAKIAHPQKLATQKAKSRKAVMHHVAHAPSFYSIQLYSTPVGVKGVKYLLSQKTNYHDTLRLIETKSAHQTKYRVLQGKYDTESSALKALAMLPSNRQHPAKIIKTTE